MGREYGVRPPGFRLPDETHVGRVRLQVANLARSIDYYEHVIGLHVMHRAAASAALGGHHADTPLVELHERRGARPVPRYRRFGLYHFALLVPDRADLGRFLAHVADADVPVASADHLVSEALYFWDPDGLGIEVYADRPRSEWRANGREVAMSTDPLDVKGLLAAGQGRVWNGLPHGTTVGHVHLHIGSLERAEALYHAALGFDKMVWSFPGALFLAAGGYHHHLGTNTWAQGAQPASEDEAQLLEWEIVLPASSDVVAAAESVGRSGYETMHDGGDRLVSDEWGSRVRLAASSSSAAGS